VDRGELDKIIERVNAGFGENSSGLKGNTRYNQRSRSQGHGDRHRGHGQKYRKRKSMLGELFDIFD